MCYIKFVFFSLVILVSSGCASQNCKPQTGVVLQGTETALVGLYIDKDGYPQATVAEVKVKPGQKIVFAGPNEFDILFKDQRSPVGKLELKSSNGVLMVEIPMDLLEREKVKELTYRYGIRVEGKVTDPSIRVIPQ